MTDEPVENAANASDAPGGEHKKRNGKPDQDAADCSREWRETVHSVRDASRLRAIAQRSCTSRYGAHHLNTINYVAT